MTRSILVATLAGVAIMFSALAPAQAAMVSVPGATAPAPEPAPAVAHVASPASSPADAPPAAPAKQLAEEEFQRPTTAAVEAFRRALQDRHVAVSVRASRGLDADAACGQLRRRAESQSD